MGWVSIKREVKKYKCMGNVVVNSDYVVTNYSFIR